MQADNPFVDKIGYESHTTGRGWSSYRTWLRVSEAAWERDQRDVVHPWLKEQGL